MRKTVFSSLLVLAIIALFATVPALIPKATGAEPAVWIVVDNATENADVLRMITPNQYSFECVRAGTDVRGPHRLNVQKITLRLFAKGHQCQSDKLAEFTLAIRDAKEGETLTYKVTESDGKYKVWESRSSE